MIMENDNLHHEIKENLFIQYKKECNCSKNHTWKILEIIDYKQE